MLFFTCNFEVRSKGYLNFEAMFRNIEMKCVEYFLDIYLKYTLKILFCRKYVAIYLLFFRGEGVEGGF